MPLTLWNSWDLLFIPAPIPVICPNTAAGSFGGKTVRRAVEYNCSLAPTSREEAELLYDNIYHLRQFLSGRTLWVGNTAVADAYPMANYNCAFEVIDSYHAYHDLFYLLMVGSGVGVRVLKEDAEKLPKIHTNKKNSPQGLFSQEGSRPAGVYQSYFFRQHGYPLPSGIPKRAGPRH